MNKELQEIMAEYECGVAKARYIITKRNKGLPYNPHKNHFAGYKWEDYKDIDFTNRCFSKRCGYAGDYYMIKGRSVSVASIVWMSHYQQDIPQGYIVNHKDENPLNNDIDNLELIPARENTTKRKKTRCVNQWTCNMSKEELKKRDVIKKEIAKLKQLKEEYRRKGRSDIVREIRNDIKTLQEQLKVKEDK